MNRFLFALSLVLFAALSRLLPHPPNVAPITALALFGGVYFGRRLAFVVPLLAMFLSDLLIGLHGGMLWVYASFAAIVCIGFWLRRHPGVMTTVGASMAGSVLFFVLTNFGMWVMPEGLYPHTPAGLAECYTAAIPFFRNTLLGDLAYCGLLFGLFELGKRLVPSLRESVTR